MYRRYSNAGGSSVSPSQIKRDRIRDLLILLLAGLLIASLAIGIPLLQQRSGARSVYIQRIQNECDDAISQIRTISPNARADSAYILARIRSDLYAIRALNDMYRAQYGQALVPDEKLLELQNTVDQYLEHLTTGMDPSPLLSSLTTSLEELRETISGLR